MARVTVFSYKKGNSLLHRLDPRFKLLYMIMLSMGTVSSGFLGLAITTIAIITMLLAAKINILAVPRELKIIPLLFLLYFTFAEPHHSW